MIETERLNIHIATNDEMQDFIDLQENDILKIAYSEMLKGSIENPNEREWYAIWMIELKDGTHIGELSFKGISKERAVEIGYGISEEYRGQGYATEAVKAVTNWALNEKKALQIEAETEDTNVASKKVLEKAGFILSGEFGMEGPRFILK